MRVSLNNSHPFIIEKPSAKFGEALRDQVEERLKFFETGEPPSKNAEAIRKVLEAIALEDEDEEGSDEEEEAEDGMQVDDSPRKKDATGFSILPLIENSPPAPSPKKKSKKRKGDDMDVDPEEREEEAPRKKVKLSKEEKKALRKEQKRKRKEEEKAAGVRSLFFFFSLLTSTYPCSLTGTYKEGEEEGEKREGGKKRKDGESGGWNYDGKAREEREEREEEKEQGIVFMILPGPLWHSLFSFLSVSISLRSCSFRDVCSIIQPYRHLVYTPDDTPIHR